MPFIYPVFFYDIMFINCSGAEIDERKDKLMIRRVKFMVSALFLAGMVSACGQEQETTDERSVESAFDKEQEINEADEIPEEVPNAGTGPLRIQMPVQRKHFPLTNGANSSESTVFQSRHLRWN